MSGKEFLLVFTFQKLRNSLEALSQMTQGPAHMLSPIYGVAAAGPMAIPSLTDTRWQPLEVGLVWGLKHGTSWLMTALDVPESMQGLEVSLRGHKAQPLHFRLHALTPYCLSEPVISLVISLVHPPPE